MITKEDLENYRYDESYIKSERKRIEEQIESVQKITSSFEETRIKSAIHDRMAENLARLMDIQSKNLEYIIKQEERLVHIKEEIEKMAPRDRNLLYYYYILGMQIKDMAKEIGYEEKYTSELKQQALERFETRQKGLKKDNNLCNNIQ